jgi:hypothetical protein
MPATIELMLGAVVPRGEYDYIYLVKNVLA